MDPDFTHFSLDEFIRYTDTSLSHAEDEVKGMSDFNILELLKREDPNMVDLIDEVPISPNISVDQNMSQSSDKSPLLDDKSQTIYWNESFEEELDSSSEASSCGGKRPAKRRLSSSSTCPTSSSNSAGSVNTFKKDSNKEAATRYRMKKMTEKDKLFELRCDLEKENENKKRQIELIQTEINYLKTILVHFNQDLFK